MLPESRNEDKTKIWPPWIRANLNTAVRRSGSDYDGWSDLNHGNDYYVKKSCTGMSYQLRLVVIESCERTGLPTAVVSVIESCERTGMSTVGRQCHRVL
ncbi:hypothetical protein E3N88_42861 [Mikania micrantha]|uniref:Uncharacterized protein n=1 Tax=Mikania micrantha TaxID=192012 RepID=A0A5N6LIR2_9ASTR|nr:hypothetical protein E3N88_42861 [Mikania micrantha]